MITRIPPTIRIRINTPVFDIYISPVVVEMFDFDLRELRPELELFFWGFFNKESNEAVMLEEPCGVRVKVISSIRPDNPVNSTFHKFVDSFIKIRPICRKKYCISFVSRFNKPDRFPDSRVKEGFSK